MRIERQQVRIEGANWQLCATRRHRLRPRTRLLDLHEHCLSLVVGQVHRPDVLDGPPVQPAETHHVAHLWNAGIHPPDATAPSSELLRENVTQSLETRARCRAGQLVYDACAANRRRAASAAALGKKQSIVAHRALWKPPVSRRNSDSRCNRWSVLDLERMVKGRRGRCARVATGSRRPETESMVSPILAT